MDHKRSMRIFCISLCMLLAAGALIIAAAQYRSQQKEMALHEKQKAGQDERMTENETDTENAKEDAAASFAAQQPVRNGNTAADSQRQIANGNAAEYRFELKVKNGYLDVYHFHTDHLFFHTGVPYQTLTLEQRQELEAGKYFINEQELYGYLESCTS